MFLQNAQCWLFGRNGASGNLIDTFLDGGILLDLTGSFLNSSRPRSSAFVCCFGFKIGLECLMISAYDTVFSSIVSDFELSELILPFLISSSSVCILLLFSSWDFFKSLLFLDISLIGVTGSSKSIGEVDSENDSTELGVGTRIVINLLGNWTLSVWLFVNSLWLLL